MTTSGETGVPALWEVVEGVVVSHERFGILVDLLEPYRGLRATVDLFSQSEETRLHPPAVGERVTAAVVSGVNTREYVRLSIEPPDVNYGRRRQSEAGR